MTELEQRLIACRNGALDSDRHGATITVRLTIETMDQIIDALARQSAALEASERQRDTAEACEKAMSAKVRELYVSQSAMREALTDARSAIASLNEFALGGVDVPDFHTGEIVGQYGIRDELLAKIDAALSEPETEAKRIPRFLTGSET